MISTASFTFVVGTKSGFGVVRDPIACKPAVMAETDQYVAFGSEYRALVNLPGIETARVWEPEPATVYFWDHDKAPEGRIMPNFDLGQTHRCASSTALCMPCRRGTNDTDLEVINPTRQPCRGRRCRSPITVEVKGLDGYYCARHEDAATDHRSWLGRAGRGRKHDVRHRHHRRRCQPICRAPPAMAACWSSRAMPPRAAAFR